MERYFNITGCCNPVNHYMVNLDSRLAQIKKMVDRGQYFCINKGRQYGKTTTLSALENYLKDDYVVLSMDFQRQMSSAKFVSEQAFVQGFAEAFVETISFTSEYELCSADDFKGINDMVGLFRKLSFICGKSRLPIVMFIDEVDQASNNQVFLDFLAQLRGYYLKKNKCAMFQSVILAGVHDIRNLRQKIRSESEHKHNSPWNIATPFEVDLSFSADDIAGMLTEYENDNHTGMNIPKISQLIYDYTSGYPVLVSGICKYIDEHDLTWNNEGIVSAVKHIINEKTPLFESLINKLEDDEKLFRLIYNLLFKGQKIPYNSDDSTIDTAMMYGFIKNDNGQLAVANRIFEVRIYNWFISIDTTHRELIAEGFNDKPQFINGNELNMPLIIEKFIQHFNDIYGSQPDKFKEDDGRKLFLLYLRPIINGIGNYYIEAQTRDMRRTDIIVDYCGKQYIIELKIWRGDEYNTQGEQQLCEYLDYYHIDTGYLLSFNFNKNKQIGMHTHNINGRTIIEGII